MNRNRAKRTGNIKKATAFTLSAAMLLGSTGVTAFAADSAKKEEVVYANLDEAGDVTGVYVVNSVQGSDITDYGTYTSVKNLTTEDKINLDGDRITIHTDADKVYYQGDLDTKEIPWNIAITYKLDGKEYKAEELAGKSGSLEINISITQNKNCDESFWSGYALQGTLTLDATKCKNIVADQATIANVGSDKQLSYIILPGKGADLTVKADVMDFEMDAISINGVKLNMDMDVDDSELTDQVKEIQDAIMKLNDGAADLNDGASDLNDGASELDDGAADLKDGADKLNDGAGALKDGVSSLKTGVDTLGTGAGELKTGASALASGAADAYDGTVKVNDGAKQVDGGMASLNKGIKDVESALTQLDKQSQNLTDGSAEVKKALSQIKKGLDGVSMNTEELQKLADSSTQIQGGIDALVGGLNSLDEAITAYQQSLEAAGATDMAQKNTQAVAALQITDTQRALYEAYVSGGEAALTSKLGELASNGDAEAVMLYQCAATGNTEVISNYVTMAGKLINLESLLNADASYISGSDALIAGIDGSLDSTNGELMKGALALQSNYADFNTAISGLVTTLTDLSGNLTTMKTGIDTLVANYNTLDTGISDYTGAVKKITKGYSGITGGAKDLADGTASLYKGTQELVKGSESLKTGAGTLKTGTESLLNGALSLQEGTGKLSDSTLTLKNGTNSLAEGAAALKDGTESMKDGTKKLSDGTKDMLDGTDEFSSETSDLDTKISDKISDTIDEMTGKDVETVSFVSDKNTNIESVLFVIKTPAIQKEEVKEETVTEEKKETFWEKLLGIFR